MKSLQKTPAAVVPSISSTLLGVRSGKSSDVRLTAVRRLTLALADTVHGVDPPDKS